MYDMVCGYLEFTDSFRHSLRKLESTMTILFEHRNLSIALLYSTFGLVVKDLPLSKEETDDREVDVETTRVHLFFKARRVVLY